jgi:integrase/recombinase XerD
MNIPKYIDLYRNEMERKNYGEKTITNYASCIRKFLSRYNNVVSEPIKINEQQIKEYLSEFKCPNSQRSNHSAIKCFFKYTLKQPNKFKYIEYCRKDKKLPIVLSVEEIQKMFNVCENKKHLVILSLLYSCGLRVSELLNLKWDHVDRSRMIINIISGKGKKDRQVMLDSKLIPLLIEYWREYKPKEYVLNGQFDIQYSQQSVLQVVKQLAKKAGIENKRVYTHLLRHCSFTHLVENGTDINLIQRLAGHSSVKTTGIYLHISHNHISKIPSPLNNISI